MAQVCSRDPLPALFLWGGWPPAKGPGFSGDVSMAPDSGLSSLGFLPGTVHGHSVGCSPPHSDCAGAFPSDRLEGGSEHRSPQAAGMTACLSVHRCPA